MIRLDIKSVVDSALDEVMEQLQVTNNPQLTRLPHDFDNFAEKTTPDNNDCLLVEDSQADGIKKRVKISSLPGGGATAWGQITGTLGSQTDLANSLAGKAPTSHGHAEADVTGLITDLAGKAASTHGHAEADVTGLTTDLAGKAASSHSHAPGDVTGTAVVTADSRLSDARTPLAHSHAESDVTNLSTDLAGKAAASHAHAESDVTNLTTDLAAKATTTALTNHTGATASVHSFDAAGHAIPSAHSHAESDVTGLSTDLAGKAASSHSHAESDITNLTTDLAAKATSAALTTHAGVTASVHNFDSSGNAPAQTHDNTKHSAAYALNSDLTSHTGAAAPHSGHEATANKGAISGYSPLDAAQKVPTVNLGGAGAGAGNYLCGDQTWKTPPGASEIAQSNRLPAGDITIAANYSAVVVGDFEIPSGYVLDLLSNSVMEIS